MTRHWGTGSVTLEADGKWRARLPLSLGRRSVGRYDDEATAHGALTSAIEQEAERPTLTRTLDDVVADYLDQRDVRDGTKAKDRRRWKSYGGKLAAVPFASLTDSEIVAWWAKLKATRSTQTMANLGTIVKGALLYEKRTPPALPLPKRNRKPGDKWTWLREHEVMRVLGCQAVPLRSRLIFAVAIYTGLRAGELWGLRWDDVDLERGVLTVRHSRLDAPKSGESREVTLLGPARAALETWREQPQRRSDRGLVFPAVSGSCHADGYDADWYELRRLFRFGRRVRFHDLRHTCASHLLQGTWVPSLMTRPYRLEEVRDHLGHSDITVTQRYAHLCPEGRHSVARLDERTGPSSSHTPDLNRGPTVYEGPAEGVRLRAIDGGPAVPSTSPSSLGLALLELAAAGAEIPRALAIRVAEEHEHMRRRLGGSVTRAAAREGTGGALAGARKGASR